MTNEVNSNSKIQSETPSNEIRITSKGHNKRFVAYALTQMEEQGSIKILAMGMAISKAVTVAEIVKRRIAGVHQVTQFNTAKVQRQSDEGSDEDSGSKLVSCIEITLAKDLNSVDTQDPGYQEPIDESQVISLEEEKNQSGQRAKGKKPQQKS